MSVHLVEATVDVLGRLVLDDLPFQPGDRVDVLVRPHDKLPAPDKSLRGSVLSYERPFDSAGSEDWEADCWS